MLYLKKSRRAVLQGLGGVAVALPIMPSLLSPRVANAQTQDAPQRRFIALWKRNGFEYDQWFPSESITLKDIGPSAKEIALASIPGDLSPMFTSPLFKDSKLRDEILLIRGLDAVNFKSGHCDWAMLSGFYDNASAPSVTIDQIMARSKSVYQEEPYLRSIHLVGGSDDDSTTNSISYALVNDNLSIIIPTVRPMDAFKLIFTPQLESGGDAQVAQILMQQRLSVIDHVKSDLQKVKSSSRLSREDRQRLDSHLTFIRELELRLQKTSGTCALPGIATADPRIKMTREEMVRAQIDNIVAAIRCGSTRIATLMMSSASLTLNLGNEHGISHHGYIPAELQKWLQINRWYANFAAELMTKLNEVEDPESGKTYLDNSIVYFGSEFQGANGHDRWSMPVMLAGSPDLFRTGRYLDLRGDRRPSLKEGVPGPERLGRPYNELLITLMLAMGLSPSEWERGGEPGFGDYTLNGLGFPYDLGNRRSPLPHVMKV